jgi:MurNAc alpha-1-phosphate uridylyltransferase
MKAMILAAGRGARMRPLTDHTPKPLLEAGGKALIVWHIERLRDAGFRDLVINHAWLGHRIEAALGDGSRFGVKIAYSPEGEALETAGGIAQALPLLGPAPFAVVNGDVFCDFDFRRLLLARERMAGLAAWLVMVPNPPQHPEGDFVLDTGWLRDRTAGAATPAWTFSGIGVYQPSFFSGVARGDKAKLAPLLREGMHLRMIAGELHAGAWTDVGTPERLAALDASLRERAAQQA